MEPTHKPNDPTNDLNRPFELWVEENRHAKALEGIYWRALMATTGASGEPRSCSIWTRGTCTMSYKVRVSGPSSRHGEPKKGPSGPPGDAEVMREPTLIERRRFVEKAVVLCEIAVCAFGSVPPQQQRVDVNPLLRELLDKYRLELLELDAVLDSLNAKLRGDHP